MSHTVPSVQGDFYGMHDVRNLNEDVMPWCDPLLWHDVTWCDKLCDGAGVT